MAEREAFLRKLKFRVLRFENWHVLEQQDAALEAIRQAFRKES